MDGNVSESKRCFRTYRHLATAKPTMTNTKIRNARNAGWLRNFTVTGGLSIQPGMLAERCTSGPPRVREVDSQLILDLCTVRHKDGRDTPLAHQLAWQGGHHAGPSDGAHIRIEHPEAVKAPGTLVLRQVPETDEERGQLQYRR